MALNLVEEGVLNTSVSSNVDPEMDESSKTRKGGLRTMPFIIVNAAFENISRYGLQPNMLFYLTKVYHLRLATSTTVLSTWSSLSDMLVIVSAFISDAYLGRFRVIVLGSVAGLLGTTLLWITAMIPRLKPPPCDQLVEACESAGATHLAVLFSSFVLISVAAGGIRPCSMSFGTDQLASEENIENQSIVGSFLNWYFTFQGISGILALTVIVYIQDHLGWKIGFGISMLLMFLSTLTFLVGSPLYIKKNATESLFTDYIRVLVVAFRNRKLPCNDSSQFHYTPNSMFIAPTDNLRYLNNACMIRDPEKDLNPEGSASDPWTLCTVEQVEGLKDVLRIFPLWSSAIIALVCMNQPYSYVQASTMDRCIIGNFKIPAGSMNIFTIVTLIIWIPFYDRVLTPLLKKYSSESRGLSAETRMGIGLILVCAARGLSAIVEAIRKKIAVEEGYENQPEGVISMSVLWLVPETILVGLAEAFNSIPVIEFFYSKLPKSMSSIAGALYTLAVSVSSVVTTIIVQIVDNLSTRGGKESWLSSNINKGHLEYFYGLLAILGLINYVYFLACCRPNRHGHSETSGDSGKEDERDYYKELPSS